MQGTRFQRLNCKSVKHIQEDNLNYFYSYEEAASAGYSPCGICKPN
ncbi:MAG: hypothetical protein GXX02_01160 [Syntrophomonadaceae bacterium]|nr:hypothetical protein [Syntrophomonadaceae bacterium]